MLATMKLRYRIFLGYTVTVFLFAAVAVAVYTSLKHMERADAERGSINQCRLAAAELETEAFKLQSTTRALILTQNEDLANHWKDSANKVKAKSDVLDGCLRDPNTRRTWTKLNDLLRQSLEISAALAAYIKEDKPDKALELFKTGTAIQIGGELRALFGALDKAQDALYAEHQASTTDARANCYRVLIGGIVLALAFSILAGVWTIRNANRAIGQATNAVSSSAREIAATVAQHERTAVAQAAMVNETTATTDELEASFRQSAEQAGTVVEVANRSSDLTEEGASIVGEAIRGMNSLKDRVGSVADQILRLGEQTALIGNIASVVKDLAVQTNMLALNAAVEATRAGEQGKGFAVVASEVRKLADQSKKSAEEAYRIVSEIQKASNSTIMVTEESIKTVDEVVAIAHKVEDLFDSLSTEAGRVFESAQQVVLNTRQQTSAIKQIGEAMGTINVSAKETAAGITQTKTGLQNLEETAHKLQKIV